MSIAALIEEWRRIQADLEAFNEQIKVQKKRFGDMKEAIITQLIEQYHASEVILPDGCVLQVRTERGAKAKKPEEVAQELHALFASHNLKDGPKRAKMVEDVMRITYGKNEQVKTGLYLMPPQGAHRIVPFNELQ